MLTDVPFFCRNYKISYDLDFVEFNREVEVNYPNKISDIIHMFDATNDQRFSQRSDKFDSNFTRADDDWSVVIYAQKEWLRWWGREQDGSRFAEVEHAT